MNYKVSAVIDKNTISGTILSDSISDLNIKLLHEIENNGIKKYIILDSATIKPNKLHFDYSFLNPTYYTNLYVDVNNIKYPVLEPDINYSDESNPVNDRIYIESELPDLSNNIISENVLQNDTQDFGARLSHSAVVNLVSLNNFTSKQYITNDSNKIWFDVYKEDVILSSNFLLNFAPEITISISGNKPDKVNLFLVNSRGEERVINNFWEYESYNNFNYSCPLTSSTKNARVEIIYFKDNFNGFRSIKIQDIVISPISQYFGVNIADRYVESIELKMTKNIMYSFKSNFFPLFRLKTILAIGNSTNSQSIQLSNGKILIKKILDGSAHSSILVNSVVSLPLNIGVFITEEYTKIYINDVEVKNFIGDMSLPEGTYTAYVGATKYDQDFDSNASISFSAYNKNLYQ